MAHMGLTEAEWQVMECLWAAAPRTGRAIIDALHETTGWSRSTTLTMLRRMTEKGAIDCRTQDGVNVYRALTPRDSAVRQETEAFLDRVYHGSLGLFLSAMTEKQQLTQQEIDQLYAILRKAEEVEP